jgi:serine/threonine protein kinase
MISLSALMISGGSAHGYNRPKREWRLPGRAGGALSGDFPALGGFQLGALVAGYRLEEQVGAGGMAVVFRARDERLGRLVALKILGPALAADAGFRRRFIAESRAAAVVDDPHIIPVYEAGEAGGVLFIAMRFVAGGDLRGVLAREGPLPPGRVAGFISPVASALDAAHRAGLVHRDVKPANILVDAHQGRPDHVYLSDFGVSKGAASSVSLTGTGHFLGTPEYAAPEQVQGLATDGRADQYALACVAWQLLTGSVPFKRDNAMAALLAHLHEPPPSLASRRPELPAAAGSVLAKALAKAPHERYGTCREFADTLRRALGVPAYTTSGTAQANRPPGMADTLTAGRHARPGPGSGEKARPARRPRRRLLVIAVACAIVAAAVAVPLLVAPGAPRTPAHTLSASLKGIRIATLPDPASQGVFAVAFGPDGILAVGDQNGNTYLWNTATKKIKIKTVLPDPGGGGVYAVAFGPDGTLVTGDANGNTYLWNITKKKKIATFTEPGIESVFAVAFGPGDTTLAVGDQDGSTYLWNLATRKIITMLADPASQGVNAVAFGPGGATLAAGDQNGRTYLWDIITESTTAIFPVPHSDGVTAVAFGPGGTLAAGDQDGTTYLWNTSTGRLADTFVNPGSDGVTGVAYGPGGTLAAGDSDGSIYLWNVTTKAVVTLTDPSSATNAVAFGPGGTTLAAGGDNGKTYLWHITE